MDKVRTIGSILQMDFFRDYYSIKYKHTIK